MRYVFLGGKAIGNYVLNGLIENGHIPAGIILYKDIIDSEIVEKAKLHGARVLSISSFRKQQDEIIMFINDLYAEAFISVAFPYIIPPTILKLVNYPINIHTGAIPKYRGIHPISAALLNDEPYQATTIHLMSEEVDGGDILLQDFIPVENEDTIISIKQKLIKLSLELILITLKQLESNTLYSKKQIGEVIWAPKRTPEDSKINFSESSRYLHNFIRALVDPYPNAFALRSNGQVVKFKKSHSCNIPGIVLAELGEREYIISSKDGIIWVETDVKLKLGEKLS